MTAAQHGTGTSQVNRPPNRWLRRPPRAAAAKAQLVCFHYAGGGTSAFQAWPAAVPDDVELCLVQLPGRENRFRERAFHAMAPLVRELADALDGQLRPPFVLFGHSMGARVAFALAHELRARGLPGPAELIVSGTPAPTVSDWTHAHHLPRAELVRHLVDLGGMPEEVLANRELLELVLPVIRADLELSETSDLRYARPLDVPMTVLTGEEDAIAPPDKMRPWARETTGRCDFVVVPGDHFFLHSRLADTLAPVLRALGAAPTTRPAAR